MDRYQRVEKPRGDAPINENEIRITTQGRMRNYISYATSLLEEKGSDEIVCKAMGRAINKTVMIAELIKRRIVGLHQKTSIGSIDITDTWEPLEEGLLPLETTRHVSIITITLSKKELDTSLIGYQPPLPADQVKPWSTEFEYEGGSPAERGRGRGGRGRGRGYVRGNGNMVADYEDLDNGDQGYGRGRWSHARGRGGYGGRGMGGYAGRNDYQNEAGGRGMRGGYAGRDDYQHEAGGRGMRGGYAGRDDYQHEAGGRGMRGGYAGRDDYQHEAGGRGMRRGYGNQSDYQHESGGRAMRGGYGGRADYQHETGGYGMRGFRGRGMRGGYGGRGSDYQYETTGFNDEAPSRGRGRGRGMGRSHGRGRGGFRPN